MAQVARLSGYTLDPKASIFAVIGDPERGPVADWRGLIARVAEHCIVRVYGADGGPHWPGPASRQKLEDLLDTRAMPADMAWPDIQPVAQMAMSETEDLHATIGAALMATWPASLLELEQWPERAIVLSGLRPASAS